MSKPVDSFFGAHHPARATVDLAVFSALIFARTDHAVLEMNNIFAKGMAAPLHQCWRLKGCAWQINYGKAISGLEFRRLLLVWSWSRLECFLNYNVPTGGEKDPKSSSTRLEVRRVSPPAAFQLCRSMLAAAKIHTSPRRN